MRLAVLTDIHGNLGALEAVLEHVSKQNVDQIIVAGDVVNVFPGSKACWDLVTSLGCPVLRGNHERYLCDYGTPAAPPDWATERFQLLAWTQRQFTAQDLAAMRELPLVHRLPGLLVTHATPRSEFESVLETTPAQSLREMFAGTNEPLVLRGHNHVWREHRWDGRTLVTVASVGMPLNGRRDAQYALLTGEGGAWRLEQRYVPYDLQPLLAELRSETYLATAGPVGAVFARELETAKPHILSFLSRYLTAVDRGELTLRQAVDEFLA